jgi:hypothetical protein
MTDQDDTIGHDSAELDEADLERLAGGTAITPVTNSTGHTGTGPVIFNHVIHRP